MKSNKIKQNELDAAGNIVVDNSEIRNVLDEWEKSQPTKKSLFNDSNGITIERIGDGDENENAIEKSIENMTDFIDEDKPGGKKSKNPKKKVGKSTTTTTSTTSVKKVNNKK